MRRRAGSPGLIYLSVAEDARRASPDPLLRGAPSGHVINIPEVRLAAGAEFLVMVCGDNRRIVGLF